jgi:RNA polymerase sigma-70 factor (ECF subfamily)
MRAARSASESKPPDSDEPILSSIRRKEYRRVLELLARAYAAPLGRFCMAALGNQAEAEELVQEILLEAHAALPQFEGRSGIRPWLYVIARRCCGHALQKRARRLRLAVLQPLPAPPEDPCEIAVARGE